MPCFSIASPTALPYVDIAVAALVGVVAGLYLRLGRGQT